MKIPTSATAPATLRVALIAGGLTQGGAEKQLTYMARALASAGAEVRVYCLTQGDYYQSILEQHQIPVIWAGYPAHPPGRVATLAGLLRSFRPHIVQSTHFFTNLYAALVGRALGAVSIGSVRSNVFREVKANGKWGPALLRLPPTLILNSDMARRNAIQRGISPERLFVLPNVIDLDEFDPQATGQPASPPSSHTSNTPLIAATAARLVPVKRLDVFLSALALARQQSNGRLTGWVIGDGPERQALESTAHHLGLLPDGVRFFGLRSDIPALLAQSDLFVLSSETEGFPNAVLEAMAARLPVIATPAGDSAQIIQDGTTGFLVPHQQPEKIAERLLQFVQSPELRHRMGQAGREQVKKAYSYQSLAGQLMDLYGKIARLQRNKNTLHALNSIQTVTDPQAAAVPEKV